MHNIILIVEVRKTLDDDNDIEVYGPYSEKEAEFLAVELTQIFEKNEYADFSITRTVPENKSLVEVIKNYS